MQFSIVNGRRVKPFPKGEGICAVCCNRTISKCGSKNLWHWAHAVRQSCDPWWENETLWHREWKSYWPEAFQEVVHFSVINGEKHIADVKTSSGLVIEFQNSAMNDEELASREEFYGNMIWVVNGISFVKNIDIRAKLPSPIYPLSQDMRIHPTMSKARDSMKSMFIYHLVSENEPDATMVEAHDSRGIQSFIDETYDGHHLFIWKHAREIWYRATVPVYLDFGENVLWELKKFNAGITRCLRAISKADFIASNEGIVGTR